MALKLDMRIISPNFETIPQALKERPQWVLWNSRERTDRSGETFLSKEPVSVNNRNISWKDKKNWKSFEQVKQEYEQGGFNGIGFVLSEDTPLLCVDLDNIEDLSKMDAELHYLTNHSYTEVSPSGTGLHIWFKGTKPEGFTGTKKGNVEIFGGQDKFVTVTGEVFEADQGGPTTVEAKPEVIQLIADKYFTKPVQKKSPNLNDEGNSSVKLSDGQIVELIQRFKPKSYKVYQGDFSNYASQSDAVMALMNDLAFYTAKDVEQMARIYNSSSATYSDEAENSRKLRYTIEKAIAGTQNVYTPKAPKHSLTKNNGINQDGTVEKLSGWWHENPNGTKTFLHHRLAEEVLASYSIVRYPTAHGDLYWYNEKKGIYEQDKSTKVIQGIIRNMDRENLKSQHVREVYQYIEQLSKVANKVSETHIAVGNGHLNLLTCELEPFSPKNFVLQKIPTNYNAAAQSKFVDDTLTKVTKGYTPSIENIKEMFACVLYPKVLVPKMFFLYGRTAHNGKSSILNMIHQTFNRDGGNISAVSPQKLATNTFAGASIYGKIANIVDDQPDQLIEDSGALKTIITGGYIEIERKGKDSETVKMETTMITASNYFPNFRESGKQINRRLHIIPFEHDFSTDQTRLSDSESMQLISSTETAEYVLKLAVQKLKEMLHNGKPDKLTVNEKAEQVAEVFAQQSDPLNDYFDEYDETYFNETPGTNVIADYEEWCTQNRVAPLGNKRFKERVCTQYNLEWKQKRIVWNGRTTSCKGFKSIES